MRILTTVIFNSILISYGLGCSVECIIPVTLKNNFYMGEGIVLGFAGDYQRTDIEGGFGLIKIAITKLEYPDLKHDTVYISEFSLGSMCETTGTSIELLKERYAIHSTISFIGNRSILFRDSIIHISIGVCGDIYSGSMSNRIRYDYQHQRTALSLNEKINEQLDLVSENEEWLSGYHYDDLHRVVKGMVNGMIVPQKYQVYLDIIQLNRTRSKDVKYYILQQLVWSSYIMDVDFIKGQSISKKQKFKLISEHSTINDKLERRL